MFNIIGVIDKTAFSIGPFSVQWYAVCILIGIIVAAILGIKEGNRFGISTDDILDGIIIIVPLSILGARLFYVLFELDRYDSIFDALNPFDGGWAGLAIVGGIITAFVSALIFAKLKKINIFILFDIMAPGFLIAQSIGRWGNFVNQEAHGPKTSQEFLESVLGLPNFIVEQMKIGGYYYQPTFLYESVWNLLGFVILIIIRRVKLLKIGELFALYMIWYGIGRFFIEYYRTDSLMLGDIKVNMLMGIGMILLGVAVIVGKRNLKIHDKYYVDELN